MVLLLEGTTDTARAVLAESIMRDHPEWRHLAIEELVDTSPLFALLEDDTQREALLVTVACQCAQELREEGLHTILSYSKAPHLLEFMRETLGEEFVAIHLGPGYEEEYALLFDHAFDTTAHSTRMIRAKIKEIIREQ